MRVQEWDRVNQDALTAAHSTSDTVQLAYVSSSEIASRLRELVEAENGCCGAAGVEFTLREGEDDIVVVVHAVRRSLPSETVLAAFSAMSPRQSGSR